MAVSSPDVAYWINAATFLVSAAFILRIAPSLVAGATVAVLRGHWRDVGDGFSVVFRSRVLLAVFCAWNLVMLGNAGINVAEIVLAKVDFAECRRRRLRPAMGGLGLRPAARQPLAPRVARGARDTPRVHGGIALMGFGALTAAISPSVWVALPCMVLGGAGKGAAVVYNSLLVQRGAPDELRGRVFTVIMSTNFACSAWAWDRRAAHRRGAVPRWVSSISAGSSGLGALVGCGSYLAGALRARGEPKLSVPS